MTLQERTGLDLSLNPSDLASIKSMLKEVFLPYSPSISWMETMEIEGETVDGDVVSFMLSEVSHLVSRPKEDDDSDDDGQQGAAVQKTNASIHMKNGEFIVMKASYPEWHSRLRQSRYACFSDLKGAKS